MASPEVYRITDYGGDMTNSNAGGYGTEYYAVVGLGPDEWQTAYNLGLPKPGRQHPTWPVGLVQAVTRVREMVPNGWVARVRYSIGGTFNFAVLLGSRAAPFTDDQFDIPVAKQLAGVGPAVYIQLPGFSKTVRYGFKRVQTTRYVGSTDLVLQIATENQGRLYQPEPGFADQWSALIGVNPVNAPLSYQLIGVSVVTDQGNNSRIDTTFIHRQAVRAFTAQSGFLDVPALPRNCDYDLTRINSGIIGIKDPETIYGPGAALPWL